MPTTQYLFVKVHSSLNILKKLIELCKCMQKKNTNMEVDLKVGKAPPGMFTIHLTHTARY
jgi:hypothetical protein